MSSAADEAPPKDLAANVEGEGAAQTKSAGKSWLSRSENMVLTSDIFS